jgi:hypothetical protein
LKLPYVKQQGKNNYERIKQSKRSF